MIEKITWIADVSSNWESLDHAKKIIEECKKIGVDYVKFQSFKADSIVSKKTFNSLKTAHQKDWDSVYDVYKKYELPDGWVYKLYKCCKENNVGFMSSPYSLEVVDWLDPYQNYIKLGSGEITHKDMLIKCSQMNKPIILAVGASTRGDISRAMNILRNNKVILMQCNTSYDGNDKYNLNHLNISAISFLRQYGCEVGLSDHSKSDIPIISAITLGARYIERHIKLDDNDSPDDKFSLTIKEFSDMIQMGNQTLQTLGNGIKNIEENERQTHIVQRRSWHATRDIKAGEFIRKQDIIALRPCKKDGISPMYNITSCQASVNIKQGDYIRLRDLSRGYPY